MRLTPSPIRPILEGQRTSVSLCNLPAQYEPDARATRLCREKGNKQVGGIRNPRPFVEYHQIQVRDTRRPPDTNVASGFPGSVRSVTYQINQQLLQLVTICLNGNTQAIDNGDRNATFEGRHPSDQSIKLYGTQRGFRQFRKLCVRRHEPPQRLGARAYDRQSLTDIRENRVFALPVFRPLH